MTTAAPAQPPDATGIGGEKLRVVTVAGIGAIVGTPAREPRRGNRALLRYAAIIEELARERGALMPVRFGTRLDPGDLLLVLTARGPALRAALTAVRHRAQMNVHLAHADPPTAGARKGARMPRRAGAAGPALSRRIGTAYLRARADAMARETAVAEFEPLRPAVQRWIRDERVEKRVTQATVYHLVPRASAEAYRRRIERAARAHGVAIRVTGPWAPYAFADPL